VRGKEAPAAAGTPGVTASGTAGRQLQRGGDPLAQPAPLAWDGTGLSGVLFKLVGAGLRAGRNDHEHGGAGDGPVAKGADEKVAGSAGADDPEAARRRAAELWARLRRYGREERQALVREGVEFQSWALCERLCEESVRVGAESPAAAVELAELAVEVALVAPLPVGRAQSALPVRLEATARPGEPAEPPTPATWPSATGPRDAERWRDRLSGYAWAFVGEARRLAGDPVGAEEAFARSRELWPTAVQDEAGQLDGLRLVELAASIRQGRRPGA